MRNLQPDPRGVEAVARQGGVELPHGGALAEAPAIITVTFWLDREPEIASPLADWLTAAVLYQAADNTGYAPEETEEEDVD